MSDRYTYLPCAGCYAHCALEGTPGEPCWGRVTFEPDYEDQCRHFCVGHESGRPYRPRPDSVEFQTTKNPQAE